MSSSLLIFKEWIFCFGILFTWIISLLIKSFLLSRFGWGDRKRSFWIAFGLQVISGIGGGIFLISLGIMFGGGIGAQSSKEFEKLLYYFVIPTAVFGTIIFPYFFYTLILFLTRRTQNHSAWKISALLLILEILVWVFLASTLFFI